MAAVLARLTGREAADADALIARECGMPIPEYFASHSEDEFRAVEMRVLAQLCSRSSLVIATGGGCVTRPENRDMLPAEWQGVLYPPRPEAARYRADGRFRRLPRSKKCLPAARRSIGRLRTRRSKTPATIEDAAARIREVLQ